MLYAIGYTTDFDDLPEFMGQCTDGLLTARNRAEKADEKYPGLHHKVYEVREVTEKQEIKEEVCR